MGARDPTDQASDLVHTAIHEAAHAVIGRVLTLVCGGITIASDHELGEAGYGIIADPNTCEYQWEVRGKVRESDAVWHARIIAFMAGAEAERVLLHSTPNGDDDDRLQVQRMATELEGDRCWSKLEPRLREMTRTLIRRHRGRIEQLSTVLLKKHTLNGAEVDRIVGRGVDDVKVNAPFLLAAARDLRNR